MMITVTDEFLEALRYSHTLKTLLTATAPSGETAELDVDGGSVTLDRTADHRRTADLTLSDPNAYPETTSDIVNVYGTTFTIKRGIKLANETLSLVDLGRYRLDEASRDLPGGGVPLIGWDLSMQVAEERFVHPRRFNAMPAISLIELLITEVYPAATFDIQTTDTTTIPKHVVDRDRWAEILRVAGLIGCEVYANEVGVWVIRDTPSLATATPVWTVDAGDGGVLVKTRDTVSREGAPNGVVALGESGDGNQPPVWSLATDDDPASPTRWGGPYGKIPRFVSSSHIKTQAQADRVSAAQLAKHLGVTRSISFDSIPNPALEPGDAVTVVYPDGHREIHMIDVLTIPLGPAGDMTAETRALDWTAE